MTRCEEFYCKVEKDGNFCNMDRTAYQRTIDYIAFCKENNLPLGGLSERAARQVIKEKDSVVKAKAIESIRKQLNKGRIPTAAQVTNLIQNVEDGKSNRGGDHKGASIVEVEDNGAKEFNDFVQPVETLVVEKDPDETDPVETDFVEVDPDEVEHIAGDEDGDPDAIPEMPIITEPTPDHIVEPTEIEEGIDPEEDTEQENPEITEKVVKEYLKNAGHEDPQPKPKPTPTEDNKQAIFEKCIKQAYEWEMNGDEIARRMEKAIMYVYPSGLEGEK